MTTKQTGPLQSYNSLTDEYLIDYFNNRRIRKHLRNMGLITKKGEVVDEPTFRYNAARKDHRSHVKDLMSQAVINKTLELERNRRAFIRDKLIEIRKIETVNRVKRDRDRGGDSDLGLRPKSAPSKIKSRTAESECMAGVNIPPGSQVKWVPLIVPPSGSTPYLAGSDKKERSPVKTPKCTRKKDISRAGKSSEPTKARCVLVNNFTAEENNQLVTRSEPVLQLQADIHFTSEVHLTTCSYTPPPHSLIREVYHGDQPLIPGYSKQPKERPKSAMIRSKTPQQQIRIAKPRPKSAVSSNPSGVASSQSNLNSFIQRRQIHSMSRITLRYLGKSLDLSPGVFGDAVEVLIMQQHCGGNTVCVYQGLISPNECFTFTSRRHRDAPFGITIYIGSLQDTRLSTCCEYKHKPGFILGGKSGHFSLVKVDGCLPCYKCFAHVDEFKKQQTEAHTKFQQSVREKQNKPLKKKKKKGKKEKKQSSSSSDSSADESSKPILDAKVSIKAKEEPPVPPSPPRSPSVTPHHKHEIVDISEDDMRQFEKLVIKSDNLDDEEDALVLQSSASDSEDGQQVEPISSTQDKQTTEPERIFSTLTTHINGYDKDIFDSDDDKKSDISDVSNKSLTSIKSNSSNKSEASTKSNSSSKSDKSNASSVKSSKSSSSSKSSASSSSIKSDKDDNSSISSIKSEDSLKDDHTSETESSVTHHQGSPPPSGSSAEILEPEVPSHSEPEASPKDDLKKEVPPQTEPEKRIPPNIEPDVSEKPEIVPQTQPEDPVVDTPEAKLKDEGPPSSPTSTQNTSITRDSKETSTPVISDTIETNEVLEAAQAKDGDIKLDAGSESRVTTSSSTALPQPHCTSSNTSQPQYTSSSTSQPQYTSLSLQSLATSSHLPYVTYSRSVVSVVPLSSASSEQNSVVDEPCRDKRNDNSDSDFSFKQNDQNTAYTASLHDTKTTEEIKIEDTKIYDNVRSSSENSMKPSVQSSWSSYQALSMDGSLVKLRSESSGETLPTWTYTESDTHSVASSINTETSKADEPRNLAERNSFITGSVFSSGATLSTLWSSSDETSINSIISSNQDGEISLTMPRSRSQMSLLENVTLSDEVKNRSIDSKNTLTSDPSPRIQAGSVSSDIQDVTPSKSSLVLSSQTEGTPNFQSQDELLSETVSYKSEIAPVQSSSIPSYQSLSIGSSIPLSLESARTAGSSTALSPGSHDYTAQLLQKVASDLQDYAERKQEGASDSDTESEMSIPSSNSETTTNHATGDTLRAESKILSPAQSILSTDSSRNKDPNRHIRFSETVIQRVASDDDN